jgi:hypothetical protein
MKIGSALVLIWLIIGALAAYQRDYFSDAETNCAETSTIAVTVVAGPLNYVGVNPKIEDCPNPEVPEPSE